jgi:pyruvate carboxylase
MVAQNLTEKDIYEKAETLSFPQSVLEYFQGYLGQPPYGFEEPLRTRILEARRLPKIEGRPGKSMPPMDLKNALTTLEDQYGHENVSDVDVLSYALYPQVFEAFRDSLDQYGDLSTLPTRFYLTPLKVGQEFSFDIDAGKTLIIKLVAIGPIHPETGTRDVYFSLNGEARLVTVLDTTSKNTESAGKALASRPKADSKNKNHVGSPMSGLVVEVRVSVGSTVKVGDPIAVMSAMKMETIVTATVAGTIEEIHVGSGESIAANDLIAVIKQ